ncbi:GTP-binding protein 1 [Termitomyces sp. T112]|nr:GTP-binding protein 1 [Termitomyces sp. T112]
MTTLRTFQTEIDEIAHRELIKQRTHAASTAEQEKENRQPLSPSAKGKAKDAGHINGAEPTAEISRRSGLHEVEEKILTLLLSHARADHDEARDLVAGLLTQHKGEYVLRTGSQPSHTHLFEGNLTDVSDGWMGTPRTVEELDILKDQVTKVVEEVGGKTCILFEARTGHPRMSMLLRLPQPDVSLTPEVRCAVVGNVDSGKSTTLGVLTRGALDDGRGRARVGLFRHKHEIETGRTSSVGMEILGFEPSGTPILPNITNLADPDAVRHEKLGWEEISIKAAKIVSFIDLAGHERYLKTTLYGLTSGAPSCVILIVGANAGLIGMSKEHLAIALALSVPIVVCVTKIDMTPPNKTAETINQVVKILKSPGCRKTPVFVKNTEAAIELATSFGSDRICPIFQISNVTGNGLDYVRTFLNLLPSSEADAEKFAVDQPLEFSVTEVWSVPYVGTVVNGILNSGRAKTGDAVLLGPDSNGNYIPTIIRSMQRKRATVMTAEAGQCVSFALKRVLRASVRKGMVLVHKTEAPPRSTRRFEGQVLILYHNTTLQKNYQAMLHCGAVRQTVRIVEMDHPQGVLRTGDRATVTFEFIAHPEFVKVGMKLLFREGKTKGLGVITRLL